jgi:hypothetical protein
MKAAQIQSIDIAEKLLASAAAWRLNATADINGLLDIYWRGLLILFVRQFDGEKSCACDLFPEQHISDRTRTLYARSMVQRGLAAAHDVPVTSISELRMTDSAKNLIPNALRKWRDVPRSHPAISAQSETIPPNQIIENQRY